MRLVVVRHGETAWNVEQRLQGATDVPLSDRGRAQAARLAERLKDETFTAIYASDLQRASDTAALVAETHDLPVQRDPRLREQAKGRWEGLTFVQIEARYPETLQCWQADRSHAPGGGEDITAVAARIGAALDSMRAAHTADHTVLVVSHGMVLRTLLCIALGLDPMVGWHMQLGNTSISELRLSAEDCVLVRLNDTCHLR